MIKRANLSVIVDGTHYEYFTENSDQFYRLEVEGEYVVVREYVSTGFDLLSMVVDVWLRPARAERVKG